jgi:hypothetical protein
VVVLQDLDCGRTRSKALLTSSSGVTLPPECESAALNSILLGLMTAFMAAMVNGFLEVSCAPAEGVALVKSSGRPLVGEPLADEPVSEFIKGGIRSCCEMEPLRMLSASAESCSGIAISGYELSSSLSTLETSSWGQEKRTSSFAGSTLTS